MTNYETHNDTTPDHGYALGGIRQTLRLEGLTVLVISIALYRHLDENWWWFIGLILWPYLAFFAFIRNSCVGAKVYNVLHSYIGPLTFGLTGALADQETLTLFALIWTVHIGMDRFVGYGLKYPEQPIVTHLGPKGKPAA